MTDFPPGAKVYHPNWVDVLGLAFRRLRGRAVLYPACPVCWYCVRGLITTTCPECGCDLSKSGALTATRPLFGVGALAAAWIVLGLIIWLAGDWFLENGVKQQFPVEGYYSYGVDFLYTNPGTPPRAASRLQIRNAGIATQWPRWKSTPSTSLNTIDFRVTWYDSPTSGGRWVRLEYDVAHKVWTAWSAGSVTPTMAWNPDNPPGDHLPDQPFAEPVTAETLRQLFVANGPKQEVLRVTGQPTDDPASILAVAKELSSVGTISIVNPPPPLASMTGAFNRGYVFSSPGPRNKYVSKPTAFWLWSDRFILALWALGWIWLYVLHRRERLRRRRQAVLAAWDKN